MVKLKLKYDGITAEMIRRASTFIFAPRIACSHSYVKNVGKGFRSVDLCDDLSVFDLTICAVLEREGHFIFVLFVKRKLVFADLHLLGVIISYNEKIVCGNIVGAAKRECVAVYVIREIHFIIAVLLNRIFIGAYTQRV